jgi:hypothetical protein
MRRTRIFPQLLPTALAVLLLALTLGLGACGPDDDSTTATAPATTADPAPVAGDGAANTGNRRPAVAVVERYYQALDGQQLRRAYDLWSESANRGTFDDFTRRHQGISDVRVELGTPSEVRRAGDVRLLDVPVTVTTEIDGDTETESGTVTVRRSVAPEAERADRRWKIDRIELGAS